MCTDFARAIVTVWRVALRAAFWALLLIPCHILDGMQTRTGNESGEKEAKAGDERLTPRFPDTSAAWQGRVRPLFSGRLFIVQQRTELGQRLLPMLLGYRRREERGEWAGGLRHTQPSRRTRNCKLWRNRVWQGSRHKELGRSEPLEDRISIWPTLHHGLISKAHPAVRRRGTAQDSDRHGAVPPQPPKRGAQSLCCPSFGWGNRLHTLSTSHVLPHFLFATTP